MKKHIKFKYKKLSFDKYEVTITEQSNIGDSFGPNSNTFCTSNGIILKSLWFAQTNPFDSDIIFLRGTDSPKEDTPLVFSLHDFNRFCQAVEEYNTFFSGEKEKKKEPQNSKTGWILYREEAGEKVAFSWLKERFTENLAETVVYPTRQDARVDRGSTEDKVGKVRISVEFLGESR